MADEGWRARLAAAVAASGKSMREISLAAQCGPGYLYDILEIGKEPTVARLIRLCREIPVSVSFIVLGFELSAENEELLVDWALLPKEDRDPIRRLIRRRSGQPGEPESEPE